MTYPGGKGGAFQHLINRIPPHRVYVESHLGGGAVFRHKRPAVRSIGIDLDGAVLRRFKERNDFTPIHGDAIEILPKLGLTDEDFTYCDPPYLPTTRRGGRLYRFEAGEEDHQRLLEVVTGLRCRVMVSGYDNALYSHTLKDWRKENFTVASRTGRRTETVWMNYTLDALHDDRFLGGSFREREQFKRKRSRWQKQFARLPFLQQQAIHRDLSVHLQAREERSKAVSRSKVDAFQLTLPGLDHAGIPQSVVVL